MRDAKKRTRTIRSRRINVSKPLSLNGKKPMRGLLGSLIGDPKRPSPAAARYALMRGAGTETHGWPDVHIHSKVHQGSFGCGCCPPRQKRHRSDPKGIARIQILLCIGWGRRRRCRCDVEDRESANAANDKVLEFVQASLLDLNLGDPEIIAGEVLVNIESDA